MTFILASASPRRKELMNKITTDYICQPADIEETVPENTPTEKVAECLALQKAVHVARSYPEQPVIGADTVVILGDTILGKPKDRADAKRMLGSLSGKTHTVITGCAVVYKGKQYSFSEKTQVTFYELDEQEIEHYLDTGEPFDKAGSYGIQGLGALLVQKIQGDYFNIVGFPIAGLYRLLKKHLLI